MGDIPSGAEHYVPANPSLSALVEAVQGCHGCDLYRDATQAVFSRGPVDAAMVFVGEQPGDEEDLRGAPFVGPAGRLLVRALQDAGIDPPSVYVTNAVKHFKFELRGKRRIHQTPQRTEIVACRPWLLAELRLTSPRVLVALGATAAGTLLGPSFRVTRSRGELMPWPDAAYRPDDFAAADPAHPIEVMATIHPSAVLRASDRDEAYAGLVADLVIARTAVAADKKPSAEKASAQKLGTQKSGAETAEH